MDIVLLTDKFMQINVLTVPKNKLIFRCNF